MASVRISRIFAFAIARGTTPTVRIPKVFTIPNGGARHVRISRVAAFVPTDVRVRTSRISALPSVATPAAMHYTLYQLRGGQLVNVQLWQKVDGALVAATPLA